ncbi:UNVERIFIED_CONTAM: hypothetical protein FKN15_011915 [Acipenser sinensis]
MSSFKCLLKSQNTLPAEGESDSQENTLPNKLLTQLNSIPSRSPLDPNMNLQDEGECSAVLSSTAEEELVWQGNLSMKIEKQDALSTSSISHMAVNDECTQIMEVHFHSGMHTEQINTQSGHPMESETQEDALGSLQVHLIDLYCKLISLLRQVSH